MLFALTALVLTPLTSSITGISQALIGLLNYTIIVFAGIMMAERKIPKLLITVIGILTLVTVWGEFFINKEIMISYFRMSFSFVLFCILAYILIRNFFDTKRISLDVILGAMAGFVLLGLIGGVAFEIMETSSPDSILLTFDSNNYDYYYYSFISLLTVGYGDVVPLSEAAKSLSILISLVGQFYMTIGIAVFVGKYLNHSNL